METASSSGSIQKIGRFQLIRSLGEGGMGAVFLATDTRTREFVALKIPQLGTENDPQRQELVRRFQREFTAMNRLAHPNLCRVRESGEADGQHFLVMDYIEGASLKEVLAKGRPSLPEALRIVRKVALAMHAAHLEGVIHRDLKPGNIILSQSREPVVVDFGLARAMTVESSTLTRTGTFFGTPAYSPPEQFSDAKSSGPQADIYSLGVILFEMITGRVPFTASSYDALLKKVLFEAPPPPTSLHPDLPAELDAICGIALAKDPGHRYRTMKFFAEDLEQRCKSTLIDEGRTRAFPQRLVPQGAPPPVGVAPQRSPAPAVNTNYPTNETTARLPGAGPPWYRSRRHAGAAVALIAVLTLGVGLWRSEFGQWMLGAAPVRAPREKTDQERILGTWKLEDGVNLMEFHADGTLREQALPGITNGTYKLLPDNQLYTNTEGILWGTNESTWDYEFKGDDTFIMSTEGPIKIELKMRRVSHRPTL